MSDIVIAEFMDEAAIAARLAGRDVLYDPTLVDRPADLFAALADCRALVVRNRTQVRGPLLAAAPRLRVVGRLGVGLDNIDVAACEARGIAVRPATGANDLSVAEYVITAALMLLRRAWFATDDMIAGEWPRMALIGRELAGKRLGLVGFGAIARSVAERARPLGTRIAGYDPFLPTDHPAWADDASEVSRWCLTMAVAALGMKTSFKSLVVVGWRPVGLMVAETLWIGALVLAAVALFQPR